MPFKMSAMYWICRFITVTIPIWRACAVNRRNHSIERANIDDVANGVCVCVVCGWDWEGQRIGATKVLSEAAKLPTNLWSSTITLKLKWEARQRERERSSVTFMLYGACLRRGQDSCSLTNLTAYRPCSLATLVLNTDSKQTSAHISTKLSPNTETSQSRSWSLFRLRFILSFCSKYRLDICILQISR